MVCLWFNVNLTHKILISMRKKCPMSTILEVKGMPKDNKHQLNK